jgi:predicted DNA-binding WGR domain protein
MAKRNLVGHCYRPSLNNDKVYMCCIRQTGTQWTVLAKWGRRGKKMNNQSKGEFSTEVLAVQAQLNLWKTQQKDGYLDIESVEYRRHMANAAGSMVTLSSPGVSEGLEPEEGQATPAATPVVWKCERCGKDFDPEFENGVPIKKDSFCPDCIEKVRQAAKKAANRIAGEDEVLICVDNAGMEDRFDVGIEYIVQDHIDPKMVYVYDKMGRKDEYFRIRFVTSEQWAKKQGKMTVNVIKNRVSVPGASEVKFAGLKPGDTIRIISPKDDLQNRELTDEQTWKLVKSRGGCTCSHGHPPCSACSDPITKEEYDELGFGRSATLPTRQPQEVVA